jgi:ATP-dependent DNA helicase RecG
MRPRKEILRSLIVDVCQWQPSSSREIAFILGKQDHKKILRNHLSPMVAEGVLAYTIPAMENHPEQRYTLPDATLQNE